MPWSEYMEATGWRYYFYDEVADMDLTKEQKSGLYQKIMHSAKPEDARAILEEYSAEPRIRTDIIN